MIVVDMSEDVGTLVSCVLKRPPNHLHPLFVQSDLFVLVVYPREEERVEAHLTEKRC